ncbi:MAG TPA: pilus assembly protein PilP [Gammaproteobacteria bacterium]|nr:pilus assembly protein PilP [Gammaproteobacteria bacterium]
MTPRTMTLHNLGRAIGAAGIVLALLGLGGCQQDMSDLRQYVQRIKSRPGGKIEPIPEMKPFETYAYPDDAGRNPFTTLSFAEPQKEKQGGAATGPKPDPTRPHEVLEGFQLDALSYVGTLQRNGHLWGLVRDPGGTIHRIQTGNYMGENYGRITGISPTKITLRELIPNPQGGWMKRKASLALKD